MSRAKNPNGTVDISYADYVCAATVAMQKADGDVHTAVLVATGATGGFSGIRRHFPISADKFLRVTLASRVGVVRRSRGRVFETAIDVTKPTQVAAYLVACKKAREWLAALPAELEAKWVRQRGRHAEAIEEIKATAAEAALAGAGPDKATFAGATGLPLIASPITVVGATTGTAVAPRVTLYGKKL